MFNRNTIWAEFEERPTVWFGGWKGVLMERFGDPTMPDFTGSYYPDYKFEILSRQMDRW